MSNTRRRTAAMAVPFLLVGLALNGCGVSDNRVRPGLAAEVDGTQIDLAAVDQATTAACAYFGSSAVNDAQPFPRALQRQSIATSFILQVALERIVAERDIALPASYGATLAAIDQEIAGQPDLDDLAAAYKASAYVSIASTAVGDAEFTAEGGTADSPDASEARGTAVAGAWLADHDVDINPVLALDLTDAGLVPADDDVSVAQSDLALASVLDLDSPEVGDKVTALTRTLPADQVCGA